MTVGANQHDVLALVDGKARLAGSNRMELLLFSLGGGETYGINVFKVREVCETPSITRAPNMPDSVEGLISLRGAIIPVVDLAQSVHATRPQGAGKLIITEFCGRTQAFHVADVDRIVRLDWERVRTPHGLLACGGNLVTAIAELPDGKLVSILDVEQILHDTFGDDPLPHLEPIDAASVRNVFFADDSAFARRKIATVLDHLGLPYQQAINGREAWQKLDVLAARAQSERAPLAATLGLVMVDAEMPEMDGYVLTRHLKADPRFAGIPVVMHSSLSSVANRKMGQEVGVDAYVAKFDAESLGATLSAILQSSPETQ